MADGHKKRKVSRHVFSSLMSILSPHRARNPPVPVLDGSAFDALHLALSTIHDKLEMIRVLHLRSLRFRGDKDPYFPLQSERAASLSNRDEWAFRLKVISSSTALHHDVFEQAVQGIVRICFPQGVLEELGIDILERHMRAENAPVENIAKMRDIFRAEMIHRITWMLSEYLDTPARVETSVQSIIAASARLHSDKIGSDVLGDVVASLNGLRARVPVNSTERLATNDVFRLVLRDDGSSTANEASSSSEVEHMEQSPVMKKKKKNHNRSKRNDVHQGHATQADEFEMNIIEPAPAPKTKNKKEKKMEKDDRCKLQETTEEQVLVANNPRMDVDGATSSTEHLVHGDRDNKISSRWKWDVDPDELTSEDIHKYFKGASDVFAFHALPIANKKLGENAKRKEIRHTMESILADMHDDEYGKWVESHQRLLAGDTGMLVRVEQGLTSNKGAATPAPIEARTPLGKVLGSVKRNFSHRSEHRNQASALSPLDQPIKSEPKAHTSASTATTTAFRHLSTKDNSSPVVRTGSLYEQGSGSLRVNDGHDDQDRLRPPIKQNAVASLPHQGHSQTPIIDLLWDRTGFGQTSQAEVVRFVLNKLDHRVAAESIGVQRIDGSMIVATKEKLKGMLLGHDVPDFRQRTAVKFRADMERKLVPWVVAKLSSFPELMAEPFIFVDMMPWVTCVLDIMCDPQMSMERGNNIAIKGKIFSALEERGLTRDTRFGLHGEPISRQIGCLLGKSGRSNEMRRGYLERTLRRIAFTYRKEFSDLKSTLLVRTWERETGQTW